MNKSRLLLSGALAILFWLRLAPMAVLAAPVTDQAVWVRIVMAACLKAISPNLCDATSIDRYAVYVSNVDDGYLVRFVHERSAKLDDFRYVVVPTKELFPNQSSINSPGPSAVSSAPLAHEHAASPLTVYSRLGDMRFDGYVLRKVMTACERLAAEGEIRCDSPKIDQYLTVSPLCPH
jgi:hypothetical protein